MEYPSQPHLGEAKRRSVHHHRARAPRRCWRDHDTRSSSFTAVRESRILRFRHSTRHKQSIMHPSSSFFSTLDGAVRAQYCTITVTTTTPAAAKSSSPLSPSPRSRLGGRGSGGATVSQSDPPSLVPSFLPSFLPVSPSVLTKSSFRRSEMEHRRRFLRVERGR